MGSRRFSGKIDHYHSSNFHGVNGFTLIEWIVAISLTVIVGTAVAVTFRNGLVAWHRIELLEQRNSEALLLVAQMREELKQTMLVGKVEFVGESEKLQFSTVEEISDEDGKRYPRIEIVSYHWDKAQNQLVRFSQNYQEYMERRTVEAETRISSLKGIEFRYPYAAADSSTVEWKSKWERPDQLPAGIEVNFQFEDRKWSSVLWIPTGVIGS